MFKICGRIYKVLAAFWGESEAEGLKTILFLLFVLFCCCFRFLMTNVGKLTNIFDYRSNIQKESLEDGK